MTDFIFARAQMALSLAFHIIFAAVGIGTPLLMAIAEGLHLQSREPIYLDLARRWARYSTPSRAGAINEDGPRTPGA